MTRPRQSIEEQNRKKALENCDANLGSIDLLVPSISGTSNMTPGKRARTYIIMSN